MASKDRTEQGGRKSEFKVKESGRGRVRRGKNGNVCSDTFQNCGQEGSVTT